MCLVWHLVAAETLDADVDDDPLGRRIREPDRSGFLLR